MKNIALCCIVVLLIDSNQIEGLGSAQEQDAEKSENPPAPAAETEAQTVQMIRLPIKPTKILPHLKNLEKLLQLPDPVKINPTDNEILWINRFKKTMYNWLNIGTAVSKLDSYRNGYFDVVDKVFDECIPSDDKTPIAVRYREDVPVTDSQAEQDIYAYNLIPYWICYSGFGFGALDIKKLDIHFERSKKKMKTPSGQMVFRKDRIYNTVVEITVPWILLTCTHELIQWGEEYDPREKVLKYGHLRVKLHNVKITMTIQLQEIDKRFLQKNPENGLVYYFGLPTLKDLSLEVKEIQRYNNQIQEKTGPAAEGKYTGIGISETRAEKIIVDLTDMFETVEGRKEICDRVKPILVNKVAEAIMTAPNILSISKNVVFAWDEKVPEMPITKWDDNTIKLWQEAFYAGYSLEEMMAKALNFMVVHLQNVRKGDAKDPNLLGDKPTDYDVGGLNVHDDGFDFTENPGNKST